MVPCTCLAPGQGRGALQTAVVGPPLPAERPSAAERPGLGCPNPEPFCTQVQALGSPLRAGSLTLRQLLRLPRWLPAAWVSFLPPAPSPVPKTLPLLSFLWFFPAASRKGRLLIYYQVNREHPYPRPQRAKGWVKKKKGSVMFKHIILDFWRAACQTTRSSLYLWISTYLGLPKASFAGALNHLD